MKKKRSYLQTLWMLYGNKIKEVSLVILFFIILLGIPTVLTFTTNFFSDCGCFTRYANLLAIWTGILVGLAALFGLVLYLFSIFYKIHKMQYLPTSVEEFTASGSKSLYDCVNFVWNFLYTGNEKIREFLFVGHFSLNDDIMNELCNNMVLAVYEGAIFDIDEKFSSKELGTKGDYSFRSIVTILLKLEYDPFSDLFLYEKLSTEELFVNLQEAINKRYTQN